MKVSLNLNYNYPKNISFNQNKKRETVAILGSSKSKDSISEYINLCSDVTKSFVLADKNILHGCGTSGIMGAAYNAAKTYSKKDEENKPSQNLAIVKTPLWGDEDIENCVVIDKATTLISKNNYTPKEKRKKIVLVGSDYFKNLDEQYKKIYSSGLLNEKPDKLYTIADTKEEILSA